MDKLAIIGIGNPNRGDDEVGWLVIDALQGKISPDIFLTKQKGDLAALLTLFTEYRTIILVDACLCDAPVGSWQRIDALHEPIPKERVRASTHGFGISQAIHLAQTLNQLPSRLFLYAISGKEYRMGDSVSPQVRNEIPSLVKDILTCMKNLSPTI